MTNTIRGYSVMFTWSFASFVRSLSQSHFQGLWLKPSLPVQKLVLYYVFLSPQFVIPGHRMPGKKNRFRPEPVRSLTLVKGWACIAGARLNGTGGIHTGARGEVSVSRVFLSRASLTRILALVLVPYIYTETISKVSSWYSCGIRTILPYCTLVSRNINRRCIFPSACMMPTVLYLLVSHFKQLE